MFQTNFILNTTDLPKAVSSTLNMSWYYVAVNICSVANSLTLFSCTVRVDLTGAVSSCPSSGIYSIPVILAKKIFSFSYKKIQFTVYSHMAAVLRTETFLQWEPTLYTPPLVFLLFRFWGPITVSVDR